MTITKLAKDYEQNPSEENKKQLEKEVARLQGQRLYAKKKDPSDWAAIAVYGPAAGRKPKIADQHTRRMAKEKLLEAYREAETPAARAIIRKGLGLTNVVKELSKKMGAGEPLCPKEHGDIYIDSPNKETSTEAGMRLGLPYAIIWHANYGRLRSLIRQKNLQGHELRQTVTSETSRLQRILSETHKKYPVEHPDEIRESLEKIHADPETDKQDRIFLGDILEMPYALTLSKGIDTNTLTRDELRAVYKSRKVPADARKKAGKKLRYSGARIWARENPVKAALLVPILPVIGAAGILSAIGNFFAIPVGEPDDECEVYYGGTGWGWYDRNGDHHKGDNR